jgi:hypothetical protein
MLQQDDDNDSGIDDDASSASGVDVDVDVDVDDTLTPPKLKRYLKPNSEQTESLVKKAKVIADQMWPKIGDTVVFSKCRGVFGFGEVTALAKADLLIRVMVSSTV